MSADEWWLSRRQQERLREVLRDDERVVLVAKPRERMHGADAFFSALPGWVMIGFLSAVAYSLRAPWWVVSVLFTPVMPVALVMITGPLRYRWRMARTFYVLTDKRAVVIEQLSLWRSRLVCWPLFPGLIKKVTKDGHDVGSLIFDYELRWTISKNVRRKPVPIGFLRVPQFEEVQRMVQEQVSAIPEDEAPFAFRPAVLSSPAPRLDAWGSPLAQQTGNGSGPLFAFATIWLLLSACFLVVGLRMLHTEQRLSADGKQAVAIVLEMRRSSSTGRHSSVSWFPSLLFTDDKGQEHRVDYTISTDNYPIGHRLTIVYMPDDVETLRIVEEGMSPGAYFTLVGSLLVLIGGGVLVLAFRFSQKN